MTSLIGQVTIDCADPPSLTGFWTAALGTSVAGEFLLLAGTPVLGLQRAPEARDGRDRMHLDLHPTIVRQRSPG
ncbi:MAG TPA: VOC family protein [Pseudonocardiaceae bacterium]|nr:VOC family protein [Pseudonocardiaceae bacterium]